MRPVSCYLNASDKAEADCARLMEDMAALGSKIEAANIKRPTAEQMQGVWCSFSDAWQFMTEEERTEALGGLLEFVEVTEEYRVHLQFFPIAEAHGQLLALNSKMGAVGGTRHELRAPTF